MVNNPSLEMMILNHLFSIIAKKLMWENTRRDAGWGIALD